MKNSKKYGLRAARKPKKHTRLSGVIHVCSVEAIETSYITFNECFVDAVGRALPFGLLPEKPAYLKVIHFMGTNIWRTVAMYVNSCEGILLWETEGRPEWSYPLK